MIDLEIEDINALVKYFNYKREPSCGSRCIDMGRVFSPPHTAYPPYPEKLPAVYKEVITGRQLNELHLVYIDSGSGWYKNSAGDNFRVSAGTALLLYPNVYHSYAPDPDQGWSEFWVGCDGSYPQFLIEEDAFRRKNHPTRVALYQGLSDDFGQLCRVAMGRHTPAIKSQLLGGVINRILGRMLVLDKTAGTAVEPGSEDAVATIISYLDERVEGEVDFKTLPDMTGMRYDKFSRLFQTETGMTPHQYYLDKKIKAAITLLQSGLSVKETSYRLSFDSPFYFSRLFKKKTGESPQAFKNRAQ